MLIGLELSESYNFLHHFQKHSGAHFKPGVDNSQFSSLDEDFQWGETCVKKCMLFLKSKVGGTVVVISLVLIGFG